MDDAMVAGIPVPSLIITILLGLVNGDLIERWDQWMNVQIKNPDASTTSYCSYNHIDPIDVYEELYGRITQHFTKSTLFRFQRCLAVDAKVLYLEDDALHVKYFVQYRNTGILRYL